jgi:catechol 2,3-dioxygenase-like lactoylglutathione lyase family enzyme
MKLNHINLTVTDVGAASHFLVKYFGMRSMGGNKGMGFLTDEEDGWGFVLTLMKARKGMQSQYPGMFHIGFFIDSKEGVDQLYQHLKKDGFDVPPPQDTGHSYGFYVKAPGGIMIELGA